MELMVESGPDKGKIFEVGPAMLVAGRQAGVDILLNDDQISRRHASFQEVNNALFLNDLGSANGTRLNGRAVSANQPISLAPGDRVQIGRTTLLVQGIQPGADPFKTQVGGDPFKTEVAGSFPPRPQIEPVNPNPAPAYSNSPAGAYPNEAPGGYYQNQNPGNAYNNSAPPPPQPYNNGPYAAPIPQPNYYQRPPQPPVAPPKKGNAAPIIIGVLAIVIIAAVAIGAIFFLSNNKAASPTSQAATNGTPIASSGSPGAGGNPTPGGSQGPDQPIKQSAPGPSGSNGLPPAPPEPSAATPTPNPTTKAGTTGGTQALGISITYPKDWKTSVDTGKSIIESDGPDGITYSLVIRRSGLSGTPLERLTAYLQDVEPNVPNFNLTQEPKFTSSDNTVAEAYVTFTDKDGKVQLRDYILAANNKAGDTYFIHFASDAKSFDSQVSIFNTILQSITIS